MMDLLILSLAALSGLALVTGAALLAFRQWLDLRRQQMALESDAAHRVTPGMTAAAQRIDIADLRERLRRLEAIAAGVDL